MSERLQKLLASAGYGSRRACEELILAGRVKVNGKVERELGVKADAQTDEISVDNKPIKEQKKVYYLLNKPAGYVTTRSDPHAEHTVMELLKGVRESVYPVGRLDVDTEGVLLFTNDGDLAFHLMHPKKGVQKTYRVWVRGQATPHHLDRLEKGVMLEDGITAPAKVKVLEIDAPKGRSLIELTIHEGRNRQVKRMLKEVNLPVMKLRRVAFAGLRAEKLKEGQYRALTLQEIERLYQLCGLRKAS